MGAQTRGKPTWAQQLALPPILQNITEVTDFHQYLPCCCLASVLNIRELSPLVTKHTFNIPECACKILSTKP